MDKIDSNIWLRTYYEKSYKKPFLFYVLFGTNNMDELKISKSKHNIDGKPEELEIITYCKNNGEQRRFIEGFYGDYFGEVLQKKNSSLFEETIKCNNVTIVSGEFNDSDTLDYFKNTIGIMQAIIESGITSILDVQIIEWFEPREWTIKYFEPKSPEIHRHIKILLSISEIDHKIWLHTRGMRKFGRPDISIRNLTENKIDIGFEIINRFIEAFAYGLMPDEKKEIRIKGMGKSIFGKILGSYDNLDFNNYYLEIDGI